MLVDLFGYIRRNYHKWEDYEVRKTLKEIKQIEVFLERKLKESKGKGVVKHVS